jgi:hypothetical protein
LVPRPATKLAAGAKAAGWTVAVTYARGWGLPVKLADAPYPLATVAVRFFRDFGDSRARGGWVVYHCRLDRDPKWEAKGLLVYGSDHWPVVSVLGVTDVGRYLVDGVDWTGAQVATWAEGLRVKVKEAKQRAADAAKARPRKAKVI